VRRAKHLLATTDDKVADIARAVGCATAQHFTEPA
jgi:transcriptional regulator GlxA family with amidase domain